MLILKRSDLTDFLAAEAKTDGGPAPCALLADRWIAERLGFSPLTRYGRPLVTADQVSAWLEEWGGLAVAARRVLHEAGIEVIGRGDIGEGDIAVLADERTRYLAIRSGERWISRNEGGFFSPSDGSRVVVAWRVG